MRWEDLARPKYMAPGTPMYQRIASSPLWLAQLKVDGWRVLVEKDRAGRVRLTTRHGEVLSAPAGFAEAALSSLPALTSLDCELERPWVKLWAFDVLELGGVDTERMALGRG